MSKSCLLKKLFPALLLILLVGCSGKEADESRANSDLTSEASQGTIIEKEGYRMKITENGKIKIYDITTEAKTGTAKNGQPYQNIFPAGEFSFEVDEFGKLYHTAEIAYNKREGGSYIYSNNPEMLRKSDVGQAIIQNTNMSGMYEFTHEHSNHTGAPFYLGYQILNEGETDAVVTVYNVGYQVEGEWLGQRSWSDFFNYRFELPKDYFLDGGEVNPIYVGCDYIDYTPEIFSPITVTVPAGEYIYVMGGTTTDAYAGTNIGGTADRPVLNGKCSNGVVLFSVEGGDVTGTFYVYTAPSQVKAKPAPQGYIVTRDGINFGAQYKGTDPHLGLIEANITFAVNDKTPSGKLPIAYTNERDSNFGTKTAPYQEYIPVKYRITGKEWLTSLNPNTTTKAIGTDMMTFEYIDVGGNPIIIDNNRADGRGHAANTGNWMVQYSDNFTFINLGDKPRTFKIYKRGAPSGALMTMARDTEGNILDAQMKAQPYYYEEGNIPGYADKSLLTFENGYYWYVVEGKPYYKLRDERSLVWTVTVEPMGIERITADALIMGNSNGGITHWVEVD